MRFSLSQTDTIVSDTGLLPNKAYTYIAELTNGTTVVKTTDPLYVRTLDTTSSNFTFQTFTLGGATSSELYDVAIINDTLAYAVGQIYGYNSIGQIDQQPYGVAVWNGRQWSLRKVYAYTQQGYLENIRPITGVLIFSVTDIWLADGNVYHWNGQDSILTPYWISGYPGNSNPVLGPGQGVNKLWGTSAQNIYGGGGKWWPC